MIIRTPRHWLPQAIDIFLTLMAWAAFAYLLVSGGQKLQFHEWQNLHLSFGAQIYAAKDNLLLYLALSAAFGSALLGWAKYSQIRAGQYERRSRRPDLERATLAHSYLVQECVLGEMQKQQILIAHNDEQGHLVAVEFPALGMYLSTRIPLVLLTDSAMGEPAHDNKDAVMLSAVERSE